MKVVALQSNYLPWKGYFDLIQEADLFIYYDEVQYTKNDWRNRNVIYSKNGLQWLTIPVPKSSVNLKISEVTPLDERWQAKHLKAIEASYGRAPYYSNLELLLSELYVLRKWSRLVDISRFAIEFISNLLGITTKFSDSKEYSLEDDRLSRLVGVLKQANATEYITGPSALKYLSGNEHLFAQNNIRLRYIDYSRYPEYRQVREPFIHSVSIVDMMANLPLEKVGENIWGWRKES